MPCREEGGRRVGGGGRGLGSSLPQLPRHGPCAATLRAVTPTPEAGDIREMPASACYPSPPYLTPTPPPPPHRWQQQEQQQKHQTSVLIQSICTFSDGCPYNHVYMFAAAMYFVHLLPTTHFGILHSPTIHSNSQTTMHVHKMTIPKIPFYLDPLVTIIHTRSRTQDGVMVLCTPYCYHLGIINCPFPDSQLYYI